MSKLHWDAETVFGLPGMPGWVRYAAIDDDGNAFISENVGGVEGGYDKLPLEADYTGHWKDSLLVRPEQLNIGDFCKFWYDDEEPEDNDNTNTIYGFLIDSDEGYRVNRGTIWKHARKFTPKVG